MSWNDMSTIAPEYPVQGVKSFTGNLLQPGDRIAVAGAGVFGGWAALFLQKSGYQVSLYDGWGAGNSRSSSGGETRLMRCVYGKNELYTRMALESYHLWEELGKQTGRNVLFHTGNLWLAQSGEPELSAAETLMKKLELPFEVLDPATSERLFPFVNHQGVGSVLWEKKSGYLMARESCEIVLNEFVKAGGKFESKTLFPGTYRAGRMQHAADDHGNQHHADHFLFACGPWLPSIFPELAGLIKVSRQEVFYFGTPAGFQQYANRFPTWIDLSNNKGFYGIPAGLGRGFKIASDVRGPEIDPTSMNRSPSSESIAQAREYLSMRFPALVNAPLLESRVCQYSNTPDGNFILDQHPEASNVWILGGGSGHGFKHGPALGKLTASVMGGQAALPFMLSLDRFNT